jgi:predicted nucleic acid-binding protein
VAYYDIRDQNHDRAVRLLKELETGKHGSLYLSEYVFDEVMTILKKYLGKEVAAMKGEAILNSVDFIPADSHLFRMYWDIFKKYDKLSFTDCHILATAKHYNIKYIATCDEAFGDFVEVLS